MQATQSHQQQPLIRRQQGMLALEHCCQRISDSSLPFPKQLQNSCSRNQWYFSSAACCSQGGQHACRAELVKQVCTSKVTTCTLQKRPLTWECRSTWRRMGRRSGLCLPGTAALGGKGSPGAWALPAQQCSCCNCRAHRRAPSGWGGSCHQRACPQTTYCLQYTPSSILWAIRWQSTKQSQRWVVKQQCGEDLEGFHRHFECSLKSKPTC